MAGKNKDTEERYRLTEWGCLMGQHMVEDFLKLMEKQGYICHNCDDDLK